MHRYVLRLYFASVLLMLCLCLFLFFKVSKPVKRSIEDAVISNEAVVMNVPENLVSSNINEVIVVLGERLHSDQMPRVGMKRRVKRAIELWERSRRQSLLLLSGSKKHDAAFSDDEEFVTEATAMLEMATCSGIPRNYIWLEERATNTAENAAFVARFLSETLTQNFTQISRVRVVTSEWHVPRARMVFEVFLAPHPWELVMEGAPDDGSPQRIKEDLVLMPSTIHDMQAVRRGLDKSLVMWAVASQEMRKKGKENIVYVGGRQMKPPPRDFSGIDAWNVGCEMKEDEENEGAVPFVWLDIDSAPVAVNVCRTAKHVFLEAHEKDLEVSNKGDVEVTKLSPLTSTTWVFRMTCKKDVQLNDDAGQLKTAFNCKQG